MTVVRLRLICIQEDARWFKLLLKTIGIIEQQNMQSRSNGRTRQKKSVCLKKTTHTNPTKTDLASKIAANNEIVTNGNYDSEVTPHKNLNDGALILSEKM